VNFSSLFATKLDCSGTLSFASKIGGDVDEVGDFDDLICGGRLYVFRSGRTYRTGDNSLLSFISVGTPRVSGDNYLPAE